MAKRRQTVSKLTGYATMRGRYGGMTQTYRLKAADHLPVVLPQGGAQVARDLCAKHGADKVLMIFEGGAHQLRNSKGQTASPTAMSRHLLAELAK